MENQKNSRLSSLEVMMTREAIQEHLNIPRYKVNRLVKIKGFPRIKLGKALIIPKGDYEKWVEDNRNRIMSL